MQTLNVLILCLLFDCYNGSEFKRVCYYTSWSNHFQVLKARLQISDIDPFLCTHAIFAFAKVNTNELRLERLETDDDNGLGGTEAAGKLYDFTNLKSKNQNLKTLLSIGGASLSKSLHVIAETRERRIIFAQNCRIYLRDRNFDGLDVDWEFPGVYRDKFTELLKAMRAEFEEDAKKSKKPRLLLSIAGAPGKENIDKSYNVTDIVKYVDFINVMAYDYFGPWSKITGFTDALYSRNSNPNFNKELSQDWTIRYWMQKGAPPEMLVMGATATTTSFTLLDPSSDHDVGASLKMRANGSVPGDPGPYRKMKGHLAYYEACESIISRGNTFWDDEQKANYAYYGNQWVGYNDRRSMTEKVKFAKSMGLGGIMFWSYDLDDFSGKFCNQGKFPLLSAISSSDLHGNYTRAPTTASTTTTVSPEAITTPGGEGRQSPTPEHNNTNELANSSMSTSKPATSIRTEQTSSNEVTHVAPTTQPTQRPAFILYIVGNGATCNYNYNGYFMILTIFLAIKKIC